MIGELVQGMLGEVFGDSADDDSIENRRIAALPWKVTKLGIALGGPK